MQHYIRPFSDLHINFKSKKQSIWKPVKLSTDEKTTLVLAGDLSISTHFIKYGNYYWLADIAQQFHSVVIVLGNHDIWYENLAFINDKIKKLIKKQGLDNVYILENESVVINNILFVGATLWTDYNNENRTAMFESWYKMNDFKYIRTGYFARKIEPKDLFKKFRESQHFIFETVRQNKKKYNSTFVITHHAPSVLSINDNYNNKRSINDNIIQYSYYSSLEQKIMNSSIDYWIHGHIHQAKDYNLGNTKVIMNAKGYQDLDQTYFNEKKLITLNDDDNDFYI